MQNTNYNMSKATQQNPKTLCKTFMEGIGPTEWGYGLRRITVVVNKKDVAFYQKIPYTFTSMGFKAQNGKWYLGLRMNIDQFSPIKKRLMDQNTHNEKIQCLWGEMMAEFAHEYMQKHRNEFSYN